MKPWNASNSSVVVVGLLLNGTLNASSSCCVLFHWKATPTRTFNEFLYEFLRIFLIPENSFKFANFFCWGNEFSIYASVCWLFAVRMGMILAISSIGCPISDESVTTSFRSSAQTYRCFPPFVISSIKTVRATIRAVGNVW